MSDGYEPLGTLYPPKKKDVSISFDPPTLAFYRRYAEASERTVPQLVRYALRTLVKRYPIKGLDMTGFPDFEA